MISCDSRRSSQGSRLLALLALSLLVFALLPSAVADSGDVQYTFGSSLSTNESKYVLYYTIPSTIQAGVKTNFTFFVYLTELSGWKIQSQRQIIQIILNTKDKSVTFPKFENNVTMYEGGRWGPFNLQVDLNDSQLGLSPGQTTNATVYANLIVWEQYNDPMAPFLVDDGNTLKLSNLTVTALPNRAAFPGDHLTVSIAVGAFVVLALTLALWAMRRINPAGRHPILVRVL